jgi:hypothetical protein
MTAAEALRRAADTVEASAIGPETDAILTLWARLAERKAMGTVQTDEVAALVRLMAG